MQDPMDQFLKAVRGLESSRLPMSNNEMGEDSLSAQQSLQQSPSGLVQGIMDEYGVGRDQAEEWANSR